MKPFLKYAGGKSKLAPKILEFFPDKPSIYYEPFVGGGSVFFALENLPLEKRPRVALLTDTNNALITTYRVVRDEHATLIDVLRWSESSQSRHGVEKYYYHARDLYNNLRAKPELDPDDKIMLAALFIYLNKTGFNGLYRENKKGEFNVPWGKREFVVPDYDIKAASEYLRDGAFVATEHFEYVSYKPGNNVVYFDPPYVPASETANFTAYQKAGFGPVDQAELVGLARRLREGGATVILSNNDTQFVRDLYYDFELHPVDAARNINSDGKKRGKVPELIIVGR